jgi:hypothetical protein
MGRETQAKVRINKKILLSYNNYILEYSSQLLVNSSTRKSGKKSSTRVLDTRRWNHYLGEIQCYQENETHLLIQAVKNTLCNTCTAT